MTDRSLPQLCFTSKPSGTPRERLPAFPLCSATASVEQGGTVGCWSTQRAVRIVAARVVEVHGVAGFALAIAALVRGAAIRSGPKWRRQHRRRQFSRIADNFAASTVYRPILRQSDDTTLGLDDHVGGKVSAGTRHKVDNRAGGPLDRRL